MRRIGVHPQETDQDSPERKDNVLELLLGEEEKIPEKYEDRYPGCQPVETISQVHAVRGCQENT